MYEVKTLFHEFGHMIHTFVDHVNTLSWARGIEWDAIEVLSKLMEKFVYLDNVIPLYLDMSKQASLASRATGSLACWL